jgi:hypothetical protein
MGNNKDPSRKQPGEKEPGTFHFNPGNMSGKTAEGRKDEQNGATKKQIRERDNQRRR